MFMMKPEQLVGQQFGSYRLTEFLKGGGFGFVYKAEHVKLQKHVAVKLLRPEHALKEELVAAFEREAKIIASFTHPHILDVYDYAVFHGSPFLVMPFIEQGSLRTLHPRNSIIETSTVISYVKQIASALQYAHDHKFVHRDVKPDNFLRGPQGVLLSDFGITIAAHSIDSLSLQDRAGTLAYMAPEQFDRKAQVWSDQYSLAVVVYEWLCGKLPFFSESIFEIERKHKEEDPPSFKQQGVDVLLSIEKVVRKGLAKKPENRYSTIIEFADALEQAALENREEMKPLAFEPTPSKQSAKSIGDNIESSSRVSNGRMPVNPSGQRIQVEQARVNLFPQQPVVEIAEPVEMKQNIVPINSSGTTPLIDSPLIHSLPTETPRTPFWGAMTINDVFFERPFIGTGLVIILCYGFVFYGGYTRFFDFSSNIWIIGLVSLFATAPFLGILFYVLELAYEDLKADFPRFHLLSIRIVIGMIIILIMVWFLHLPLGGSILGTIIGANLGLLILFGIIMAVLGMITGDV